MDKPEIIIVGAGPAGLTAGIYAARAGYRTLVLERGLVGGQVALTSAVENYPGFSEPVNAVELAQAMEQQARNSGCEIENTEATGLEVGVGQIRVETAAGRLSPAALIICSGVLPKQLGVPGEKELRGRGVSYCAVCDGPLFRNKEVAVVGGGDSALDEALYLSGLCSRVHLIHRRDQFRGVRVTADRVRKKDNVNLVLSTLVTRVNGHSRVESVDLFHKRDSSRTTLPVSGVFFYVGSVPNTAWCKAAIELDANGFIKTDDRLQTSVLGIFAAGDVRTTHLRQIATSVGDGALAAMMVHHHLLTGGE